MYVCMSVFIMMLSVPGTGISRAEKPHRCAAVLRRILRTSPQNVGHKWQHLTQRSTNLAGWGWIQGRMSMRRKRVSHEPPVAPAAATEDILSTPTTEEMLTGRGSAADVPAAKIVNQPSSKAIQPISILLSASFSALALGLTTALVLGVAVEPTWPPIIGVLVSLAVVLLGVDNVHQIGQDLLSWLAPNGLIVLSASTARQPCSSWLHVPLTDADLNIGTLNKFANSCQVREKGLKILQYVLKGGAYSKLFGKGTTSALKSLSKSTSIARRFFKFCRWIKHFDDLKEAKTESNAVMRALLYLRVAANLGADWAEDVCSLERIGFLPAGTLSVEFMLFAEYCQLALALIEIGISTALVRAQQEASEQAAVGKAAKEQRKLALVRLELVKFVSDLGKAIYDCEVSARARTRRIALSFSS